MNRLLLFFIFIYLPFSVFPQGIWKTYTREDGLAGDTIRCITQDKLGNYWLASRLAGLSKLDTNGVFTNYMNTDSTVSIYDIEIDSLNNKWFAYGTRDGQLIGDYVVKFDDSSYTYYEPVGGQSSNVSYTCLGQDSFGQIWCGNVMSGWTLWFDSMDWHVFIVPGSGLYTLITDIKTDRNGKLYFTHSRGISTLDSYIYMNGMIEDIAFDRQNRMWFGGGWGLGMYDEKNWYSYSIEDSLLFDSVRAVAVDSSNNIWFSYGSSIHGVSKFNGKQFFHYNQEDGLASNNVWDIYVDRKGDIWFGTNRGVCVLHDTTSTSIQNIMKPDKLLNGFVLFQNYPNPFNPTTTISYQLPAGKDQYFVTLKIYDALGRLVKVLVEGQQAPGIHQISWDGTDVTGRSVASGIYFYTIQAGDFRMTKKMVLMR